MRAVIPSRISLTAKELTRGRIRFCYREYFAQKTYSAEGQRYTVNELIERTLLIAREKFPSGLVLRRLKAGLEVSGIVERKMFGDMMTGEFLGWSSLGQARLVDLLIGAYAA